jgi:hypothetical protein
VKIQNNACAANSQASAASTRPATCGCRRVIQASTRVTAMAAKIGIPNSAQPR